MKLPPIKPLIDTDARTNPHALKAQDLMYGKASPSTQYTVEETLSFMKNGALTYKDIFSIPNAVIMHVCNTAGGFGKGFAGEVAKRYPEIKKDYKFRQDILELGNNDIYFISQPGWVQRVDYLEDDVIYKHIVNMYAMKDYARSKADYSKCFLDYSALKDCLVGIKETMPVALIPVIPYGMGAGNAGGDWKKVIELMDDTFDFYLVCKLP